jgi:hypothetical protein
MTQDVGRLHKERQAIEQQIADLFAFYSKQKQSSPVCIRIFAGAPPVAKYLSETYRASRSFATFSSIPAECCATPA